MTRRWTLLTPDQRDRRSLRLLGVEAGQVRLTQPDGAGHYRALVVAARAGDPDAFAWLATSHRPLLLLRGADLLAADATEWGSVCLELLYTGLHAADLSAGRWLRRQISRRLAQRLGRRARLVCRRPRLEHTCDPGVLDRVVEARQPAGAGGLDERVGAVAPRRRCGDPLPSGQRPPLWAALGDALDRLDVPTRDGLLALADGDPVAAVADRHRMSHATLWQRVHRARLQLQPQFAVYRDLIDP